MTGKKQLSDDELRKASGAGAGIDAARKDAAHSDVEEPQGGADSGDANDYFQRDSRPQDLGADVPGQDG